MLQEIKQLLDLAYQARDAAITLRRDSAKSDVAWQVLNRVTEAVDGVIDRLLEAYAAVIAQEKATNPVPEIVA